MGLLVGLVFFCFALTPSLLPMPPLFEGFVTGISLAVGYLVGVTLSWLGRKLIRKEPPAWSKDVAWVTLLIGLPVVTILYIIWSANWQNQVRDLIGEEPLQGYHFVTIVTVAIVVAFLLMLLGRSIAWLAHKFGSFAGRWVPSRVGTTIGVLAAFTVVILLYNGVLVRAFVSVSNDIYHDANNKTKVGVVEPQSGLRSGGPDSFIPWSTLGRQGRSFVAGGPTNEQLTQFNNGKPATSPIRVYAGLQSADSPEERAELAVAELARTGAFDRKVLAVMTATGTGWIEPQSADSLEYIWNGDTALVSMQYSYLPSWISFLVDQENATDAGRALFNAVYDHWAQLPENKRPQLIPYGLSLGAFAAQSAFSGVDDMQNRTSGALFMGSPSFSQPWGYFTKDRDEGSPQWQPVYDQGKAVRFAATRDDLYKLGDNWESPRIVYMQHASDPVVWWSFDLILNEPDWLKEPRGPDVTPLMQWYPFVTFAQVTINQFFAITAPQGHGHNYGDSVASAWAAITSPPNWSEDQADKLHQIISEYATDK